MENICECFGSIVERGHVELGRVACRRARIHCSLGAPGNIPLGKDVDVESFLLPALASMCDGETSLWQGNVFILTPTSKRSPTTAKSFPHMNFNVHVENQG